MRQKGKFWIDAAGNQIPATRVTDFEKQCEAFGQQIAIEAEAIETKIRTAKDMFLLKCEEIITRHMAQEKKTTNQVTFYTFDKAFRIEYKQKERQVTIYRAVKKNPAFKDYEVIIMDLTSVGKKGLPMTTVEDFMREDGKDLPMSQEDYERQLAPPIAEPTPEDPGFFPELSKSPPEPMPAPQRNPVPGDDGDL